MLSRRVKYVRLLRKPGKRKDRWYAQLSLEGKPAIKHNPASGELRHPVGQGAVGLDIGPQTLAYSACCAADLVELADRVQNIEQVKRLLLRKMDRSRRATNPDNYTDENTAGVEVSSTLPGGNAEAAAYRTCQPFAYLGRSLLC